MAYDVRSIANFVLDIADQQGIDVSNMSINKIVYFLHGWSLAKYGKPLVSAKIEAWEHGPVFRELYREFKRFGDKPIKARARKIDLSTGLLSDFQYELSDEKYEFFSSLAVKYIRISAFKLRMMSHQSGGPWDSVWNHDSYSKPGMCITDEIIQTYFAKQARH